MKVVKVVEFKMYSIDNDNPTNYESVDIALNKFLNELGDKKLESEEICVSDSLGRILYDDIVAQFDLPTHDLAQTDGYAINSGDVALADDGNPVCIEIVEDTHITNNKIIKLEKNQGIKISSGTLLPQNTNAVVSPEFTSVEGKCIRVFKSIISGENVYKKGDDIKQGNIFIRKQRKVRPLDIGGMINLGFKKVKVFKKPVISVQPVGDELLNINEKLEPGKIYETNSYVLRGLVKQLGGISEIMPIIKDNPDMIKKSIEKAVKTSDVVIISGGSSIGADDFTYEVIKDFKNSRMISNDIAMRPGKHTLLAYIEEKPVIGLSGHPAANVTAFLVFIKSLIVQLAGNPRSFWQEHKDNVRLDAVLEKDVESPLDTDDYIRVRLKKQDNGRITAYPYAGKPSSLSTLVKAHGYVKLPADCTKLYEGDRVEVLLF